MIYTERTISVKNGDASIDAPIVLYRGDRNIEIVFEIINSKFKFSEKGNYILDIGAKYGQLAVDMPDGTDLFTEIAECLDGKVIFKITGDMINEIAENGFYSFHVRLFNDDKTSRVTIPPIMEGIEIREPIVIEGDAIFPIVDMGGADIAPIDSDEETFIDENGKLDIRWVTGDIISSTRLNQMVGYINENTYSRDEFDLSSYVDKNYLDTKIEYMDVEMNAFDAELANTKYLFESINSDINEIKSSYVTEDYVNDKNNDVIDKIRVVESEVDALQAGLDITTSRLNDYATADYVDQKDTELSKDIASLDGRVKTIEDQISEAALGALREDLEGLRNTHGQDLSDIESDMANLRNEIDEHNTRIEALENSQTNPEAPDLSDYTTKVYVDEQNEIQNEALEDHRARIEALENSQTNPEAPDLSDYTTKVYVDGEITKIRGLLSTHYSYIGTNMQDIEVLEGRLGQINAILDAINGEEI